MEKMNYIFLQFSCTIVRKILFVQMDGNIYLYFWTAKLFQD